MKLVFYKVVNLVGMGENAGHLGVVKIQDGAFGLMRQNQIFPDQALWHKKGFYTCNVQIKTLPYHLCNWT